MFDTILPYKFVQRNRNTKNNESFLYEFVYCFFYHKGTSKRKYIVIAKEYENKLFTIAFYAKTTNLYKYRITTKQNAFGKIGGTVLAIMAEIITNQGVCAYGIEAAPTLEEETDEETKRFRGYLEVLARKVSPNNFKVYDIKEKSHIFVIRIDNIHNKTVIVKSYGSIFSETQY